MSVINKLNTDKWKVNFTNFPIPTTRNTKLDLAVFNNNVKNITLPDFSLEHLPVSFGSGRTLHTISKFNNDLSSFFIEFAVDEDLENYFAFYDWYKEMRSGRSTKNSNSLQESTIKQVLVQFLDNQGRRGSILKFYDCVISSISSLTMSYGTSDYVPFSVTFLYDKYEIERSSTTKNN